MIYRFFIFLLLLSNFCIAQQFIYEVKVVPSTWLESVPKNMKQDFIETKEKEQYSLTFNDKLSLFQTVDGLDVASPVKYYKENNDSIAYLLKEDPDFGKLTIKQTRNANWVLTGESKAISGYTCFKATSTTTLNNMPNGRKQDVTAWYCPKFPYAYGPLGYGNLPGLIFELQIESILYGVVLIDLKTAAEIENIDKKKAISQAEYINKIRTYYLKN